MNLRTSFTITANFKLTSLLLLVSLLFAGLSHSHSLTYDEQLAAFEQLDCKLCQVQVELPKQKIAVVGVNIGCFYVTPASNTECPLCKPHLNLPQQRAPPIF